MMAEALIVRNQGRTLRSFGALVLAAPILAVVGAIAAFATKVKIEIVRDEDAPEQDAPEADSDS